MCHSRPFPGKAAVFLRNSSELFLTVERVGCEREQVEVPEPVPQEDPTKIRQCFGLRSRFVRWKDQQARPILVGGMEVHSEERNVSIECITLYYTI